MACFIFVCIFSVQGKAASTQGSLQDIQKARNNLQKTLQAQQDAVTRHEILMHKAMSKARLSNKQLRNLNKKQQKLETTLKRTKLRLQDLTHRQEQLEKGETFLQTRQEQATLMLSYLLPVAENVKKTPELMLVSPRQNNSDALLTPALLQANLNMTQQEADRIAKAQNTIHQRHEILDQQESLLLHQNLIQQKRKKQGDEQTRQVLKQNLADQQALETEEKKLQLARKNMQDLTAEIESIAKREALLKKRLEAKAKRLAQHHKIAQAHKVEQAAQALNTGKGIARGQGLAPVKGIIITHWHQNTEAGPSTGVTYKVSNAAPVMAPCDGRLLYTGAFRSFGNMVILDCGHSQRFVLAGFGRISASVEQHVNRKKILGTMPDTGGTLFVQLRQGTHIVNPAPFLQ